MKTIKIIDLLNKIANGEKVPKEFTFAGILYKTDDISKYSHKDAIGNSFFREYYLTPNFLNNELEIIEEEKEIEKLRINNGKVNGTWENGNNYCYTLSAPQTVIINKINELIEAVNEMRAKNE